MDQETMNYKRRDSRKVLCKRCQRDRNPTPHLHEQRFDPNVVIRKELDSQGVSFDIKGGWVDICLMCETVEHSTDSTRPIS